MKKFIGKFLPALVILVSLIMGSIPVQAADATCTIRVHYYRPDGNYEKWRVFCWDADAVSYFEGGYYYFRQEGEEMVELQAIQLVYFHRQYPLRNHGSVVHDFETI